MNDICNDKIIYNHKTITELFNNYGKLNKIKNIRKSKKSFGSK